MTTSDQQDAQLRIKLNQETSKMPWQELLRHFAAGTVIAVSGELDLIDVAACFTNDDKASVAQWLSNGQVVKVSDAQAATWLEADMTLWTVVVRPWVLVQPEKAA
jgi:hypothetical protein